MTTKRTTKSKNTNTNAGGQRKGRGKAGKSTSRRTRPESRNSSPPSRQTDGDGDARQVALAIAEEGLDKKALNVEVIDVRGKVDYADYVVVMSGGSDRQVSAITRGVEQGVEERGVGRCLGVEGLPGGNWVLMDFGDVVVHVFHKDTRGYYDLESLWIDAARVDVAEAEGA